MKYQKSIYTTIVTIVLAIGGVLAWGYTDAKGSSAANTIAITENLALLHKNGKINENSIKENLDLQHEDYRQLSKEFSKLDKSLERLSGKIELEALESELRLLKAFSAMLKESKSQHNE